MAQTSGRAPARHRAETARPTAGLGLAAVGRPAADAALQFELNRRFHQALIAPCSNHFLLTLIDQLWDHPVNRRITRSYIHGDEDVTTMIREHREILQASLDGDPARLLGMATEHMRSGYRHALDGAAAEQPAP